MPFLNISQALAEAAEFLRLHGLENPRLDAEVLLGFVLNKSRTELYIYNESRISKIDYDKYQEFIQRRARLEPVAYITGEKEFMSLPLYVDRRVLIPRPETEMIVEEALEIKPLSVVDVGTGSGAIAVSTAYYLPNCSVTAVDISAKALEVASLNASRHGVSDRIRFVNGNLLTSFPEGDFAGMFDFIAANLPYIPSLEMSNLPMDVRAYEPSIALDGGIDGLDHYRQLCRQAFDLLCPGGVLLMEIGYDQGDKLNGILKDLGYVDIELKRDLALLDRLVKAIKKG